MTVINTTNNQSLAIGSSPSFVQTTLTSLNPNITYTGTWTSPFQFTTYETSSYINGVFTNNILSASYDSPTAQPNLLTLNLGNIQQMTTALLAGNNTGLTSFVATNLISWIGSSGFAVFAPNATTLSLPNLIYASAINSNFQSLLDFSLPALVSINNTGTISLTITAATTLSLPLYIGSGSFIVSGANALTSVNLSSLVTCGQMTFASTSLTTLNFPALTSFTNTASITLPACTTLTFPVLATQTATGTFGLTITCATLTTLSFPALTSCVRLQGTCALLTTLSCPLLATITSTAASAFNPTYASLTTFSFPSLVSIAGEFNPTLASCTTVSLPVLTTIGSLVVFSAASLATLSFPSLLTVASTFTITAANLVTFSFNAGLLKIGGNVTMTGMSLNQASVDGVLVSLANLNGSGGTTAWSNLTVNLSGGSSSTPSSTGLAAKATLVTRGCTVTTN